MFDLNLPTHPTHLRPTPLARLQRLWSALPLWGAMLVVLVPLLSALWSLLMLDLAHRQRDIRQEHENRIYNVTQISAQALYNLLIAADQTLLDLRDSWAEHPETFSNEVQRRRRTFSLGIDFHISIIGGDGRVRYSSLHPDAQGMNVSKEFHFERPRNSTRDRIFVGAPHFTQKAQTWVMPFSRRLPAAADGSFNGVIVFWVSPDFVNRIYKTARLKPLSSFTIMELGTGQVLLRHIKADAVPPLDGAQAETDDEQASDARLEALPPNPGENIEPAALQRARLWPATGVGSWASSFDNVVRTYAWHKYLSLPIALVTGEPAHHMQRSLDQLAYRYHLTGGTTTLLLGLASFGLLANSRGRSQAAALQGMQLVSLSAQQAELLRSQLQLRQLSQHLADVRENERHRMAQDIHDELGQRLTVLRMGTAQLMGRLQAAQAAASSTPAGSAPTAPDYGQFQPALQSLKSQLDDSIAVVRQIAEGLRPSALSVSLSAAVESLCDEFRAGLGFDCVFKDLLPPELRLSEDTATVAYRIVQEGLTNITRHAHAFHAQAVENLAAATRRMRVLPRPGKVHELNFPVVMTGEVDGTVYLLEAGKPRGIGNAEVELVDPQGVVAVSTRSGNDGYYILPAIKPGRYTVRINPAQLDKLALKTNTPVDLLVRGDGDFVNGMDFVLRKKP